MTNQLPAPPDLLRDGTSQADRYQSALEPGYVSVDERSSQDLLAFARTFAPYLKYYDHRNQESGDWRSFFDPVLDRISIDEFMNHPENFTPQIRTTLLKPHFVLFLTFLKLLDHARQPLNRLTQRHLDYYYRSVLDVHKRAAIPDRLNVLIVPAKSAKEFQLSAGTRLDAGTDSLGRDQVYRTDRDVIVNQIKIDRLCSVYVQKVITGIREARELHTGPKEEAFMRMLAIGLGEPEPGDPMPPYEDGQLVDLAFLRGLTTLTDFMGTGPDTELYMAWHEFRELMRLKLQRDRAEDEWAEINRLLEKAGQKRSGDPNFRLRLTDPRDFDANLAEALNGAPIFDGITEVNNINDLYDQRNRSEVQDYIHKKLYFDSMDDFLNLMRINIRIDSEWHRINAILEKAGQRKNRDFRFPPADSPDFDPTDFAANLALELNPDFTKLSDISNLDQYHAAIIKLESYTFMPAEHFAFLMAVEQKKEASAQERDKVYGFLASAYREKVFSRRRRELADVFTKHKFAGMIRLVLGEPVDAKADPENGKLLERLRDFKIDEDDFKFLQTIEVQSRKGEVTAEDLDKATRILEMVQRVRENLPEPVPQKVDWLNIYPYNDAAAQITKNEPDGENQLARWKTFGQVLPDPSPDSPIEPVLGWAISSPQLALGQGDRTVTLTLGFDADRFDNAGIASLFPENEEQIEENQGPFCFGFTTAGGWIEPKLSDIATGKYHSLIDDQAADASRRKLMGLKFTFEIGADIDALAPLPAEDASIDTAWPALRLMLRQIWDADRLQYVIQYPIFQDLQLATVHLNVSVSGLTGLRLQNDETILEEGKPFEPFGSRPAAGSRLYLGHPELNNKRIDSLKFDFEWMGIPKELKKHYANYPFTQVKYNHTTQISLVDNQVGIPLDEKALLIKDLADATNTQQIEIKDVQSKLKQKRSEFSYQRKTDASTAEDLLQWNRYLQWTLNTPDFQHHIYPTLAAAKSVELASQFIEKTTTPPFNAENYKINPPYTPKIKSFGLAYTSSLEISVSHTGQGDRLDQIFHIHPFGYNEVLPETDGQTIHFLPQHENEGELYLGLQDVEPPQRLSVLFQMAEGSANPDLQPAPIRWSCLDNNRWRNLDEGNILLDTTRGLINSGIIEFDLPAVRPSTRMPPDRYWVRAVVLQDSGSICDTVAIHPQAVSATFEDNGNAPDHYRQPLAANSIKGLVKPVFKISAVLQPYTSYGGKSEEQDSIFYTRVSERLRHKHRALTFWDYERLILEHFPQIYKVKCIPANAAKRPFEPGRIDIIVIPDIRNRRPFDPLEPKAPADLIASIETYMADKIPAWASVNVRNACYLPVKIRIGVRFKAEVDAGYFRQVLNEELNRFLSPWAYEEGADIVIGGKIYANSIVNFIDRREYVDYVAGIKLFINRDGRQFELVRPTEDQGYFVEAREPDAVLVAARQHDFDTISDVDYDHEKFTGINYMKIELDFIVG